MTDSDAKSSDDSWIMPARRCPIPGLLETRIVHTQEEQEVGPDANKSGSALVRT